MPEGTGVFPEEPLLVFGDCVGLLLPEAHLSADSRCIECLECEGLFSPQKFVGHSHSTEEIRTCHWGFDSANWKIYLRLWEGYTDSEKSKFETQFENFKKGFPFLRLENPATPSGGMLVLDQKAIDELIALYDKACSQKEIVKFVPASGAAS